MFWIFLCFFWSIPSSQGFEISGCKSDGLRLLAENYPLHMQCITDYAPDSSGTLTWEIRPWRNQPSLKIVCTGISTKDHGCSSHPEVEVTWTSYKYSYLTGNKVERAMFNNSTVSCNTTWPLHQGRRSQGTSCRIHLAYFAVLKSCGVEVQKASWTVNIDVAWKTGPTTTTEPRQTGGVAVKNYTSIRTSFMDASSGYVYYRSHLPFSFPLPPYAGRVYYDINVAPSYQWQVTNQTVVIEPPGDPELSNCNQCTFVEGGNYPTTPCVCRVTSLGSPSGRLQWMADDVVLVSGGYGVTQLVFPYDKLTRTHDGMDIRCQLDWVVKRETTSFTSRIIYAPDSADIFVHNPTNPNDDANMTLLCEPYYVSALSDVMTTWGGLCQGQQGRMCTLTPPIERHDGKEVTCTVTNKNFPGKQVTTKWIVKVDKTNKERNEEVQASDTEEQTKTDNTDKAMTFSAGVGIGVGVTLVVALVVVGVMLVVLWRRHLLPACLCCVPTYDSPSKKRQKEEAEQRTYTDLSHYEPVGEVARSSIAPGHADRTAGLQSTDHVYVNTAAL